MEYYLDTVYLGRAAYGIEAGAQAYFGVSAKDLTVAQGIVLAGIIKQPEGKKGSPYDYLRNPQTALDRFNYVRDGMVQLGFLKKEEADKLQYPKDTLKPYNPNDPRLAAQYGLDTPTGFVVHHVLDELTQVKDAATGEPLFTPEDLKTAGYRIVTTLDKKMEDAALAATTEGTPGAPLYKQPPNLTAALVAVEPGTGRVRAYYGGPNGSGLDMAGVYNDPVLGKRDPATGKGEDSGSAHPPGSSFKVYTLGAALREGISIQSYWNGASPREFPKSGRTFARKNPVKNSGDSCPDGCFLWQAVQNSMNTPLFAVAETITAAKVIDFARDAGVHSMWRANGDGTQERVDLTAHKSIEISPKYFSTEVGIGQYPITVAEHANGVATVAARGLAATQHFVSQVTKDNQLKYGEKIDPKQINGYTKEMGDDEDWTLQQVMKIKANGKNQLAGGRDAAGKTGTWQRGNTTDNAHAWFVGFTASDPAKKVTGLATAVWVGNKKDELSIKDGRGNLIYGSSMPGDIWKKFMDAALKGTTTAKFAPPKNVGDADKGELKAPDPNANQNPPGGDQNPGPGPGPGGGGPVPCDIPALCPTPVPTVRPSGGGGGGPQPPPLPRPTRTRGR
jgi:membrane peptidoglycan carboxypeptidase